MARLCGRKRVRERRVIFSFCICFEEGGSSVRLERTFQSSLIQELLERFPGCFVLKLDPNYIQGIPDLLVLWRNRWAVLECKQSERAAHRPNQDYYISILNEMSFARFICPENKEEVLRELQSAFQS